MFWDRAACVYDLFANVVNRRANRALCDVVAGLILPTTRRSSAPAAPDCSAA